MDENVKDDPANESVNDAPIDNMCPTCGRPNPVVEEPAPRFQEFA